MKTLKAKSQLVARCFFAKSTGKVKYDNYSKYYEREKRESGGY